MSTSDRMPPIPADQMTEAQSAVVEAIVSGPRGSLPGPYVPLMRSPELMDITQKLGEYLRFRSPLPANVKELAILVIARLWDQGYEWAYHLPLALKAGVARETAEAIAEGRRPDAMSEREAAAYDLLTELNGSHQVSDPTYARALAAFGEHGVVDLTGFSGCYSLLAMVMNTARTPAPEAEIPLAPRSA